MPVTHDCMDSPTPASRRTISRGIHSGDFHPMFRGYRYALIAVVGWLVFSSLSYAQQQPNPALESQPVAPSQQGNTNSGSKTTLPRNSPHPEILTPALQKIEFAIRDSIAKKDDANDQRQEARDKADLEAQESMAFWSKLMFWATAFAAAVTFGGLVLIWRTLHHTRRAADYALDMVAEAKAATKAAQDAVEVTRKIGEAQSRAYLTCIGAEYTISKNTIFCNLVIANKGQSPADEIVVKPILKINSIDFREALCKDERCEEISAGSSGKASFYGEFSNLGENIKTALFSKQKPFAIRCDISWYDVFNKKQTITIWLHPPVYIVPFTKKDVIKLEDKFIIHFDHIHGAEPQAGAEANK